MPKYYIGIDTGWDKGACVIIDDNGNLSSECFRSPGAGLDHIKLMIRFLKPFRDFEFHVALEKCAAVQNKKRLGVHQQTNLVENFFSWKHSMDGLGIKYALIERDEWNNFYPEPPNHGPYPKMPEKRQIDNLAHLRLEDAPMDYNFASAKASIISEVKAAQAEYRERIQNHFNRYCRRIFPGLKLESWNNDAVLIANYIRIKNTGGLSPAMSEFSW